MAKHDTYLGIRHNMKVSDKPSVDPWSAAVAHLEVLRIEQISVDQSLHADLFL